MADAFDGVVIGGGHNGLVLAAYLSRAGHRVAVAEEAPKVGGGCCTEESTLPGFKHNLHSNFYVGIEEGPIYRDLELDKYGFRLTYPPVQQGAAFSDGTAFTIHTDIEKTVKSIAQINEKDAKSYRDLHEKFYVGMKGVVTSLLYSPPIPPSELRERLSDPLGQEFMSYNDLTMYQSIDQHFEDERIRAFFKILLHAFTVEDLPSMGLFLPRVFSRLTRFAVPVGGSVQFPLALTRIVEEGGGRIYRSSRVERILVEGGEARGVEISGGTRLEASRFVASAIDFPQTVRLAGEEHFGPTLSQAARDFKWASHSLATLHLALEEPPRYASTAFEPDVDRAYNLVYGADDTAQVRECFEDVKRGELPRLIGNGACNTLFDPTYAPAGKHAAFWWPFAPYAFKEGGADAWDERRDEYAEKVLDAWRPYAPNLTQENVLGKYLFTPLDIERRSATMVRGSHHVGAYLPEQLGINRPHPDVSDYRTPIGGLYLCGASSHVGGAVTGGPGYNAANAIADDLKIEKCWTPVRPPGE